MEVTNLLCDSYNCRLCAEENKNSVCLFPVEENEHDLSQLINKYLPIKVESDGKFPKVICPGCYIQLEATKQFLDLIIDGQHKLREFFRTQQETLRRQEKQKQQLESALKNVNPNSSVETYTIQTDEDGEKFVIQILSEGPLFPPEHELTLKAEGLEKPKRKRGRPPKAPPSTEDESKENDKLQEQEQEEEEADAECELEVRKKRKIKVPSRFQEAVQELDRMFKEEGVMDDGPFSDEDGKLESTNGMKDGDEIIGRLQNKDGEDLGEVVVLNKNTNRVRIKLKEDGRLGKRRKLQCKICFKRFLHPGRYEVHKSFHKVIKYSCSEADCQFVSIAKIAVEEHQEQTQHSGIIYFEDLDDYGKIELPEILEDNEINSEIEESTEDGEINSNKQIDAENRVVCTTCNKSFSCKQNYEVHCKAVHENQRPYRCDKCEKAFAYVNSLKCHMLQHSDKNEKLYACEICKKIFNHPSSLVYHREAEHNNGRRFVCNKCNKSFKHKQLLQRHQAVHSDIRPFDCKLCDASFKTRANLLNHMPVHTGEKKYYCQQCGQSFAHKTSLTLHIRWHSGQKPYECDVCMKSFSQKGNLAEHKRIHTGEKPYCCDQCGRKFTTSSQFKLHIKRHTGERPWRCEYCSKSFLHKDTWKCHTRRHRNERPYQCQQCFRGFTEQWALKKHERLHTGEKPYVCDICNKGFADCSNLTKHKRIHSNAKLNKDASAQQKNIKVVSVAKEGENQILYLTYQDSNSNDSQMQTLVHVMDPINTVSNDQEQSNLVNSFLTPTTLPDPYSQFQQFVDEDGSVLGLTTADGQQIKVLTTIDEAEPGIQGLMANGTLVPISLNLQNGKSVASVTNSEISKDEVGKKTDVECKSEGSTNSEEQMLENDIQFLNEDQKLDNGIQFLTDGQNICLVAAYNIDEGINPQYLAIA